MQPSLIGQITLNISLVLYLSNYIPQLRHNRDQHRLQGLSLSFHFLLLNCFLFDLIYGIALNLPWQYVMVSSVGLFYLFIQQTQLYALYKKSYLSPRFLILLIALISLLLLLPFSQSFYLGIGYLVQTLNILFYLPQIIKNYRFNQGLSLSLSFLLMHTVLITLDNASAWLLNWPLPSRIGAFIGLLLSLILFSQWLIAKKHRFLKAKD